MHSFIDFFYNGFLNHPTITCIVILTFPLIVTLLSLLYAWAMSLEDNELYRKCSDYWLRTYTAHPPRVLIFCFGWILSIIILYTVVHNWNNIVLIFNEIEFDGYLDVVLILPMCLALGCVLLRLIRKQLRKSTTFFKTLRS